MPGRRLTWRRGRNRLASAALSLALVTAFVAPPPALTAAADPREFPETGYRIERESFGDFFGKRGGVRTFGYPVSHAFGFQGCTVQFFQRLILQQCGEQGVSLLNLLDAGLLPYTQFNGSTVPAADPALAAAAPSPSTPEYAAAVERFIRQTAPDTFEGEPVRFGQTFLSTVGLAEAFPDGAGEASLLPLLNLQIWGFPTSAPARDPHNRAFIYQRFQRGIMHYDATTGQTQGLLLADYLKALLTGQGLPADLAAQATGHPLLRAASAGPLAAAFNLPVTPVPAPAFQPLAAPSATPRPATAEPSQSVATLPPVSDAERKAFIEKVAPLARQLRQQTGLPPSLVTAIAINETGWGRSRLAREANNYFGIKAARGVGTAGTITVETWEVVDGQRVAVQAAFRAYHSLEESIRDLGAFLRSSTRYDQVWKAGSNPVDVARAMLAAGYATDPAWVSKLEEIVNRYNLRSYD